MCDLFLKIYVFSGNGLGLRDTDRLGKSESTVRQTNILLFWTFSFETTTMLLFNLKGWIGYLEFLSLTKNMKCRIERFIEKSLSDTPTKGGKCAFIPKNMQQR